MGTLYENTSARIYRNQLSEESIRLEELYRLLQSNFNVIKVLVRGTLLQEACDTLETNSYKYTRDYGDKTPAVYAKFIVDQDDIPPAKAGTIERVGNKKAWRR